MKRVTDEDDGVREEELFDVDVVAGDELDVGDVAAGQVGGVIQGVGNHEDLARCGDPVDAAVVDVFFELLVPAVRAGYQRSDLGGFFAQCQ